MARKSTELLRRIERKLETPRRTPQPRVISFPRGTKSGRAPVRERPGLEQLVRTVAPSKKFPQVYVILDSSYLTRMSDQDIRNLQSAYSQDGQEVHYIMTDLVRDEIENPSSQKGGRQANYLMPRGLRNYLGRTLDVEVRKSPNVPKPTEDLIRQTCSRHCRKQRKYDTEGGQNGDNIEATDIGILYLAMELQKGNNFVFIMSNDSHITGTVRGLKGYRYRIESRELNPN